MFWYVIMAKKQVKIDGVNAYNEFFALILIAVAPIEIKFCSPMNTWSFSIIFAQQVSPWRYSAPQSSFTKIGSVLLKIQLILSQWLKLMPKMFEIDAKDSNQPNKKGRCAPPWRQQSLLGREAIWSPGIEWSMLWQSSQKDENSNWPNEKGMMCPPPEDSNIYNREAVDLLVIEWSIVQWLSKEDE